MKKFLAVLSLVAFVGVNVSLAETPTPATKETKKETVATKACCKGGSMKSCTAEQAKNCTPAEKAACATKAEKAGCAHDKKAEAGTEKKAEAKGTN